MSIYIGKVRTSHVGAGSLGDGPILRNFIITVFNVIPKHLEGDNIIRILNNINSATIEIVKGADAIGDNMKRALNFYVWVDVQYLELKKRMVVGKKLQGYDEIVSEIEHSKLVENRKSLVFGPENLLPIIDDDGIVNVEQFDAIVR